MFDEDLFKLDTSVVPSAIRYLKESKQNIYVVKSCYQHVLEVYCCSYPNNIYITCIILLTTTSPSSKAG